MALIHCPECDKEVSSEAATCIGCGYLLSLYGQEDKSDEHHQKLAKLYQTGQTIPHTSDPQTKGVVIFIVVFFVALFIYFVVPQSITSQLNNSNVKSNDRPYIASKSPIESKKAKELSTEKTNEPTEEKRLFEEVKKIPASELKKNRDLYQKLVELNPKEPLYKKKLDYYDNKIKFAKEASKNTVDEKIMIATLGTRARLCPTPNCGENQHLARIPKGTELSINGTKTVQNGYFFAKWFKVNYNGNVGWVSIYDTDKQ